MNEDKKQVKKRGAAREHILACRLSRLCTLMRKGSFSSGFRDPMSIYKMQQQKEQKFKFHKQRREKIEKDKRDLPHVSDVSLWVANIIAPFSWMVMVTHTSARFFC